MEEEQIIELLREKRRTYFDLKRELGVDFGRLDYYLLKLKDKEKIRAVREGGEVYYTLR